MSRQRVDVAEARPGLGPLFDRPLAHLFTADDPATSRAAATDIAPRLPAEQRLALAWLRRHPGKTAPELGLRAYVFYGTKDPEWWRQRIGRRLPDLLEAKEAHRDGQRDRCAIWWPGSSELSYDNHNARRNR